jgi:hypothetical protein
MTLALLFVGFVGVLILVIAYAVVKVGHGPEEK